MSDYAPIYRFLARAFLRPPDSEILELASELLDLPDSTTDAQQHTWLFEFNVYPYASVYLDPTGMLNAPWSGFVAGVYGALDLDVSLEAGLAAPDHISAQLEALATLLEREESASTSVVAAARHVQRTLLLEHLLPWLPTFHSAVQRLDEGLYAKLSALALEITIEHLETFIDDHKIIRFIFPEPDNEAAEGKRARDELTKFFLPARSGMFLSREDVMRLGRSLDLPVRFAERSFMLEQLALAAADAEMLDTFFLELKGEAERQLASLVDLQENHTTLAPLWEEQATKLRQSAENLDKLRAEVSV